MKLLKVIKNKDVGFPNKKVKYRIRKAARAVLFDKNKIALLFASKYKYHKLPGGGVEKKESIKKALAREIMEETGCTAKVKGEVGKIIEYRDNFKLKQFSYCYIAEVTKKKSKPKFTEDEKAEGFKIRWVSLDNAIKIIENDKPKIYERKFMITRDLIFLKKAEEIIKQK
jgi:8-oxo-dGTP pyrophosphatase MutT (NUDIX family)